MPISADLGPHLEDFVSRERCVERRAFHDRGSLPSSRHSTTGEKPCTSRLDTSARRRTAASTTTRPGRTATTRDAWLWRRHNPTETVGQL